MSNRSDTLTEDITLADRNSQKFTDIYTCTKADFQEAMQRLYHDEKHASNLEVNVLNE